MDRSLTGRFETRRDAELAIEHLVQEQGIDRSRISVLPLGAENTAGTRVAGSDAPDAQPGTRERDDAALHGAVEVSVSLAGGKADAVRRTLEEAGARDLAEA
ncbi:hypothetical protein EJV46_18765 [Roseococcus sp. SYP-B2431]|uniref:hypothetical protein n=1 Tax=Roseococcus sp. SYP-B2431 TaxID=2496640 RepID=UPI00103936D2|nr:hypothetical protein [Roseococcus sp. SYP-B2431]TCH96629.1 hypothetical protein EJV46_18765 [Roseococcus sp. SYP-B2431]